MGTEADTCRLYVVPRLQAAGWDSEPHSIAEQCILDALVDKHAEHGLDQFKILDELQVPPISGRVNVGEIAGFFGEPEQLRTAVQELQVSLYAA